MESEIMFVLPDGSQTSVTGERSSIYLKEISHLVEEAESPGGNTFKTPRLSVGAHQDCFANVKSYSRLPKMLSRLHVSVIVVGLCLKYKGKLIRK